MHLWQRISLVYFIIGNDATIDALSFHQRSTESNVNLEQTIGSRREWIQLSAKIASAFGFSSTLIATPCRPALATNLPSTTFAATKAGAIKSRTQSIDDLKDARKTLATLLENWEKAVIDCTYADVPRELLEQRNKELLLEKAATSALFDKSASVVSCKTNNRIVRDYIGATGKGPVVGLEKKLKDSLEFLEDPDGLELFVQNLENLEQALAKAKSLSYTAGVADFSTVNNFAEAEKQLVVTSDSNLEQARQSISVVVQCLDKALALLDTDVIDNGVP